jgi:phage terminase large subunit
MNALQVAVERIREWRHDAVAFVRDMFGVNPDRWQRDALMAFSSDDPKHQRIAMQACAGPGKSAVLAWCGLHFLVCQGDKDHHPNGYAMSVTGDNLKDNLWKEFAVWRARSPFLITAFEQTSERIFARDHPKTWWIAARTWSKSADPDAQGRTLSGLHSRYILYLPDEAGDIAPTVTRSAEQGLSNCEWGKIVMAGNPTSLEGMLYTAVSSGRYYVIQITGDPDDPKRSPRIDIAWARQMIEEYGIDNPWVMAYILGRFPPSSINALLGPDDVYAALKRGLHEEDYIHSQKRLGIDVARFGDNRTVIFPRQGLRAFQPKIMRHNRGHEIAAAVAHGKAKWGSEVEFIDDTGGWGAGTIDACLLGGIALIPVNVSSTRTADPRYYNVRSELNFKAAEWIKRGGCLPHGLTEIVREAVAPTYWFEKGKFRVEEKEQIKVKLQGQSPDLWDALCLTFAMAEMPTQADELLARLAGDSHGHKLLYEYDPWEANRT